MLLIQGNKYRTFDIETDVNHPIFRVEMSNLCHDIVNAIDERLPDIGSDMDVSEDAVTTTNMKNAMLWQFVAFVTQRPNMPQSEVLDIRLVDDEKLSMDFFQREGTAIFPKKPITSQLATQLQIDGLKKQIAELEAKNAQLQQANEAMEQQAINAMRYRASKRHHRSFESLDDYISHQLRTAVREELEALGLSHV